MRICMHTSFLEGFRQKYRFLSVLAGLGGMRGDVTGMGEPPEDLQDILANVGDLKISSEALQPLPLDQDTSLYAINRSGRLHI